MDAFELSPIFNRAFLAVCKEYGFNVLKIVDPKPSTTKFIETRGIDILIYFTQEIEGMLVLSFEQENAIEIAKLIDIDPGSVNLEITREIIAELGNLTAARANAMLTTRGISANITPPSVFCGMGSQIYSMVPNLFSSEVCLKTGIVKIYSAVRQREKQIVFVD